MDTSTAIPAHRVGYARELLRSGWNKGSVAVVVWRRCAVQTRGGSVRGMNDFMEIGTSCGLPGFVWGGQQPGSRLLVEPRKRSTCSGYFAPQERETIVG